MIEYRVDVSGPGGCVNHVAIVIEKALRDAGFGVDVQNAHADPPSVSEKMLSLNVTPDREHVRVSVTHYPWGG
jgi:hypothetical protein